MTIVLSLVLKETLASLYLIAICHKVNSSTIYSIHVIVSNNLIILPFQTGEHCYAQVPCSDSEADAKAPESAKKPVNPKPADANKDEKKDSSKSTKDDTAKKGATKDDTKTKETGKTDLNKDEKKIIDDAKKIIANEKNNEIAKEKEDSKSSSSYAMAFSVLALFVLSAILYFVCKRGSASNEPLRLYKALPRQEPV